MTRFLIVLSLAAAIVASACDLETDTGDGGGIDPGVGQSGCLG
jgi:hypothetical protein